LIGIAVITGLLVGLREVKKSGQDADLYFNFFFIVVVACIIGARIYYVIFSWDEYKNDLLKIFAIREGGLAIYGVVIAAAVTAIIYNRIKKYSFPLFTDTGVFGLIIGQAIGRYGNFTNREAFGGYTNSLFAMQYRTDTVPWYDKKLVEPLVTYMDATYIQVHPTFFYESMWNICLFIALQFYKKHKAFDGEIFLMYLGGYGLGRLWIEGLRTDQLKLFGTGIPVSQLLSGLLVAFSIGMIIYNRFIKPQTKRA